MKLCFINFTNQGPSRVSDETPQLVWDRVHSSTLQDAVLSNIIPYNKNYAYCVGLCSQKHNTGVCFKPYNPIQQNVVQSIKIPNSKKLCTCARLCSQKHIARCCLKHYKPIWQEIMHLIWDYVYRTTPQEAVLSIIIPYDKKLCTLYGIMFTEVHHRMLSWALYSHIIYYPPFLKNTILVVSAKST